MMQLDTAVLTTLTRRFQFSLLFLCTAVLQLACMALELSFVRDMTLLAASVIVNLVSMLGLTACWVWGDPLKQSRQVRVLSVVWAVLAVTAAITMHLGVGPVCLLAVAMLAAIYRFAWLHSTRSTGGIQRQFAIDTALFIAFSVFVGVGVWAHSLRISSQWLSVYSLMTLVAILGWVSVLWSYERSVSGTRGASRSGIFTSLAFAVFCGLFGLRAVYNALLFVLGATGVLFSPVTQLLPNYKESPHAVQQALQRAQQAPNKHAKGLRAPNAPIPPEVVHIAMIVIAILAALVLCWLILKRKSAAVQTENEDEEVLAVVSRRATVRDDELFLPTDHPVRLRLQQWLRRRIRAKGLVQPSDTVKRWASGPDVDAETQALLKEYEQIRYGEGK